MNVDFENIMKVNYLTYVCRHFTTTRSFASYEREKTISLECELGDRLGNVFDPLLHCHWYVGERNGPITPLNTALIRIQDSEKGYPNRYSANDGYPITFHLGMEKREFKKVWNALSIDGAHNSLDAENFTLVKISISVPETTAVVKQNGLVEIYSEKFVYSDSEETVYQSIPFPADGECYLSGFLIQTNRQTLPKEQYRFDYNGDPI